MDIPFEGPPFKPLQKKLTTDGRSSVQFKNKQKTITTTTNSIYMITKLLKIKDKLKPEGWRSNLNDRGTKIRITADL